MDKRYLSRIAIYILLAVFALALILELCYHFYSSFNKEVETLSIVKRKAELKLDGEYFILRSERTVSTDEEGGICKYLVSDGTKVGGSQKIAEIALDSEENREKLLKIEELSDEIETLEWASRIASGATVSAVETKLSELRARLCSLSDSGDVSEMSQISDELSATLIAAKIVRGELKNCDRLIAEQKDELSTLKNSISGKSVKSDRSGYFYSKTDGFEGLLSPSDIDSITFDDCVNAIDAVKNNIPQTDNACGKLVTSFDWYALCVVDTNHSAGMSSGKAYTVDFGETTHKMTLLRVVRSESSEKTALIFESNTYPSGFDFARVGSVSVIYDEVEGYDLPAEAVHVVNGVPGVYVLHGNVVEFRQIETVLGDEGSFFSKDGFEPDKGMTALSFYDLVILKGKDLYVGKIVD